VPALVLAAPFAAAAPAQPIGSAVTIVNLVTAELDRDTRSLRVGDWVHQNESIEVGLDAKGEIKLDDDTKLALGPGSRLKLDKFVYDPEKNGGSIALDLVKGTFRFMTGVAAKPSYVIRTPAASITVRGTIFDVYVASMVWILLHEGAIRICNERGRCRVHDQPGKLIRITPEGDVGTPVKWAALPGKESTGFDSAFPFVVTPPSIDPNPIFTRDVIVLGNLPETDKPHEAEPDKPARKKGQRASSGEKQPKPKKKRTAKKGSDDGISGMDIVIGVGITAIGRRGHKHHDQPQTHTPYNR
jgi:hypothetical protein